MHTGNTHPDRHTICTSRTRNSQAISQAIEQILGFRQFMPQVLEAAQGFASLPGYQLVNGSEALISRASASLISQIV
jgi:hypothetical protein